MAFLGIFGSPQSFELIEHSLLENILRDIPDGFLFLGRLDFLGEALEGMLLHRKDR